VSSNSSPSRRAPVRAGPSLSRTAIVIAAFLVAGCATIDTYAPTLRSFGVYKLDVNQGNFLSQDMVDKLKVGQTKQQVKLILGTPLVVSVFRDDRWDYTYEFIRQGQVIEHRNFSVYFTEDKLARWEGDEMPRSAAELNRQAAALTSGEAKWSNQRSWWDSILDVFRQ
jgi:outer membrane protein assembly factor BamE